MEPLLKQIQERYKEAADVLMKAEFKTDMEIQSLTREDLNELFPGIEHLRQRKEIFNMIRKPIPTSQLREQRRELMGRELTSYTQNEAGVLMDQIDFMKQQINIVHELLDVNVGLLKDISTAQQDSKANKGSVSHTADGQSQGAQGPERVLSITTLKYKVVVKGKTFGTHSELMRQVWDGIPNGVQFVEDSQDGQFVIVFCPITSRIESDVNSAMTGISDDKKVILVKMHHVCEAKASMCGKTTTDHKHVVLQTTVFYHEQQGLLKCQLNYDAIAAVRQELLKMESVEENWDVIEPLQPGDGEAVDGE